MEPTENGVCLHCGSGVILGGLIPEHIRDDIPCIENPRTAEFWWENHTRLMREGRLPEPVMRNPSEIRDALSMIPAARKAIREAHQAGQRYRNIMQYDAGYEIVLGTAIARLLDAGVLQRGPNS